jgi:hypothetical protein
MRRSLLGLSLLSCVLSLAVPGSARAESAELEEASTPPSKDTGVVLYGFAGHSGWDASALEVPLAAMGYSSFSADPGSGGLGLRGWSHGFMGALELQLSISEADATNGRHVSLDAGHFTMQAGRVLAATRHVRTYAMAGLGYGVSSITPGPGGLALPYVIGIARGQSASNFALDLQSLVGVDYLLPMGRGGRGFNGVFFGMRAGYNVQPLVSSWTLSNGSGSAASTTPVGLPRLAENGPFVHIVFGDLAAGR